MDINGHDGERGGWMIAVDGSKGRISALVPDALLIDEHGGSPVSETAAQDWIATNRFDIETALAAKAGGRAASGPFDRIVLIEET